MLFRNFIFPAVIMAIATLVVGEIFASIFAKEKNYKRAIIEFQTHSPHIRANIMNLLKKGGFTSSKSLGNVRIQNQEEIKKFFELVGSSNPKNVVRYKYFLRTGFIPKKEKLMRETVNFGGSLPYKRL